LPPYIKRGAAKVAVFGVEGILIDDARQRDIDQQRARIHQGKPAGIDQSCRFRRKGAGDQDRVAKRQHAVEVAQGKTVSAAAGSATGLQLAARTWHLTPAGRSATSRPIRP